jgi:hypothetical protein
MSLDRCSVATKRVCCRACASAYRGVIRVEASDPGGNLLFASMGPAKRRIDVEPLD